MKVRYEVRELAGTYGMRFEDLKEAFNMAKACAVYCTEMALIKMVWNTDNRIESTETCIVKADGSFTYI